MTNQEFIARIDELEKQLAEANAALQAIRAQRDEKLTGLADPPNLREIETLSNHFNPGLQTPEGDRLIRQLKEMSTRAQLRTVEFEAVIDAMIEAVVIFDRNGLPERANRSAIRTYGFDPRNLPRRDFVEKLSLRDEDGKILLEKDLPSARALSGLTVRGERYRFTNAYGEELIILVSASPIYKENELVGCVIVWHDISEREKLIAERRRFMMEELNERQQAEQALRESEKRFRELADSMPQLVWTALPDGRVDYYNQRYQEFRGIAPQTQGNWEWSPVLHPDDLQKTVEAWNQAVQSGEPYQIEHRVRMADGSYRWHMSRGVPVKEADGKVIKWYGTATDIHTLKLAEEDLRDRNERLSLLSDVASELLRVSDPGLLLDHVYGRLSTLLGLEVYLHYNLSVDGAHLDAVAMSGWPDGIAKELEHKRLDETLSGTVVLKRQTLVVDQTQINQDEKLRLIHSAGISAYVCSPLIAQDRLMGTLAFGSRSRKEFDPSSLNMIRTVCDLVANAIDRKRAEDILQNYTERLEQSNRDLQDFAYVASHDLQEPLRKIEAFGDTLISNTNGLDERQRDYLERMRKAAKRMRNMVDSLLELSRLTTRAQPFSQVNLTTVANDALQDLEYQIRATGGTMEVGPLPVIDGDATQISQLFQNLLGNSLKFHKANIPPKVKVSSRTDGSNWVEIRVEDNGIGFSEEYADRIFQPFQRLVGRSEFEGSGMGLAICRRIVERHGGEIHAKSTPGEGSTFIVRLPRKMNHRS